MTIVCAPHIPYARFEAALRAGRLEFIQEHAHQFTLDLADEAEVCRLIAEQDPARLETASVQWIKQFAAKASGQRREDYKLILRAFDTMMVEPKLVAGQLRALCAARGLDR
jgi:hypothetical protein